MICISPRFASRRVRFTTQTFRTLITAPPRQQMGMPLLLGERRSGSGKPILASSNTIVKAHVLYIRRGDTRGGTLSLHKKSLDVSHRSTILCMQRLQISSFDEEKQLSKRYLKFDLGQLIKVAVETVHARGARYCNISFAPIVRWRSH